MDWDDTPQQAAFRAEVRTFLRERLPARYREQAAEIGGEGERGWQADRASEDPAARAAAREWGEALSSRGWFAPHWPQEYGGAGLTTMEQFVFSQEMAALGAPLASNTQSIGLLGPTLIVHGSEEQRAEHLPRILSGEVVWAQGYSEPGAGSDLAAVQTRAVRDGDEYVVNGQKIWTTGAHTADWLFALVRTDPSAPKHRGISFLLLDIKSPGISIRPLIDAAWEHRINETFFEDVRVPVRNRLGEENRGWYVAVTLLDFERSAISGAVGLRRALTQLLEYVYSDRGRAPSRLEALPTLRAEVADRFIEIEVTFNLSLRIASMQSRGLIPNYEASMGKLFSSETGHCLWRTGTRVFGLYANLWDAEDARSPLRAFFTRTYVSSIPSTIGGGSSEIQRNIIATRGLGLPRA